MGKRQWSKTRRTRDGGKVRVTKYGPNKGRSSGCFPSAARVLTPNGWRAIGTIQAGDIVVSYCPKRKILACRSVIKRIDRGLAEMWAIYTENHDHPIAVTRGHSLLTDGGWVWAKNLKPGDFLITAGNAQHAASRITKVCRTNEYLPTHNLRTQGECNFIVEHIVAHNFSFLLAIRGALTNFAHQLRTSVSRKIARDRQAAGLLPSQ
jgi:hypothetical protein